VIAQRWIVALRPIWAALAATGVAGALYGCAPSDQPTAAIHAATIAAPAVADLTDVPRRYGSSTEPRARHRPTAKRLRHRHDVQQAQVESVNPSPGAGE
jgi:hypothetical protein